MGKLIFILGGARAGKSSFALKLAKKSGKRVTFIATATPMDLEMKKRIKAHKNTRPKSWKVIEITNNLDKKINQEKNKVILVDCLTIYVYHLMKNLNRDKILSHIKKIIKAIKKSKSKTIVVSNEVGSGIVPNNKLSREYRDVLGRANQMFALAADEFYLMFAGIPINIKKLYGKN
jgi:adenosylcobinamide kinase/adenosylcobinamide-phosphate guanylyltransferase